MSLGQDVADGSRHTLALDEVDDLDSSLGDVGHVLSVGVLHELLRSSNTHVSTSRSNQSQWHRLGRDRSTRTFHRRRSERRSSRRPCCIECGTVPSLQLARTATGSEDRKSG